jgi:hypothetical protein
MRPHPGRVHDMLGSDRQENSPWLYASRSNAARLPKPCGSGPPTGTGDATLPAGLQA